MLTLYNDENADINKGWGAKMEWMIAAYVNNKRL